MYLYDILVIVLGEERTLIVLKYFPIELVFPVLIVCIIFYYLLTKHTKKTEKTSRIISPVFYTLGKKYRVHAVHEYISSNDMSGYTHVSQNSRPDQWDKLINIRSSFFNLRHEIKPIDKTKILAIIISKNGEDPADMVLFNKHTG